MSSEDVPSSTCDNQTSGSFTRRLFLISLAFTIWLSSAVSTIGSDRQTSAAGKNSKAQLLFFTARWCAPCRQMKPYLVRICNQYKMSVELIEIEYDAAPLVVQKYEVESLPTLILLDDSGKLLIRLNESSEEGLKVLSSTIRRLAESEGRREKSHGSSDFSSPH